MAQTAGQGAGLTDLPWPGMTFGAMTRNGKALLGTPHGTGIGFFLSQHRDQISKQIESVTIWLDVSEAGLIKREMMLITLTD